MTMQTTDAVKAVGNVDGPEYDVFLKRFRHSFYEGAGRGPLFHTDATGLWDLYLESFRDLEDRQHHNCNTCRHFIERFGGLVTINEQGEVFSAMWAAELAPDRYRPAFEALARAVHHAKVTDVFLSGQHELGTMQTGAWRHFSLRLPLVHNNLLKNAGQAMAEKREDYRNIKRALGVYSKATVEQALKLLKADALSSAEKVIGPVQFLYDLHSLGAGASNKRCRDNLIWLGVATAPAGFCHPRSGMAGTLLDDIAEGKTFDQVKRAWDQKMHPLRYMRPQAAPTTGAIAAAEKVMEKMGLAKSLERRFARFDEVPKIWTPKLQQSKPQQLGGVFSHLKAKDGREPVKDLQTAPQKITWVKFRQTVLPEALRIQYLPRRWRDSYMVLVTAADPEAPPLFQWDLPESRNPVSWYVWHGGSSPADFGLQMNVLCDVSGITLKPNMWQHEGRFEHHGNGVIFLLEGARETKMAGNALFPSMLRTELHGIRSVIEAYSKEASIAGAEDSSACGIAVTDEGGVDQHFRVTTKLGAVDYLIDRWD